MGLRVPGIAREDFDEWTLQPENYDKIFEHIGGVVVERDPHYYASVITTEIMMPIFQHIQNTNLNGHLIGAKGGYIIAGDRYVPNLSFLSRDRLASLSHENCYLDVPPDMAMHMIHPDSLLRDAVIRVTNYLCVGTTVWYVHYRLPEIHVFTPGKPVEVLAEHDILVGGAALPGFTLPVKDIFPKE
jgi:Uma2 family endonuclease